MFIKWRERRYQKLAASRAAKGAALLDEKRPDWAKFIDLDKLNIISCIYCILSQSYGSYVAGLTDLFSNGPIESVSHGFMSYEPHWTDPYLNRAWALEVLKRRNPSFNPPVI